MKLNKTIGRVATTLVATAMLASLAAVPAMAEDANVTFTKTIDMTHASGATVPDVTYSYVVSSGTAVPANSANKTPEIKAGDATDFTLSNAVFTHDSEIPADKKVDATVTADFADGAYTDPGIYRYEVTETHSVDITGLSFNDDPTYTVDVYVAYNEDNQLEVQGAVWMRNAITPTLNDNNNAVYGDGTTDEATSVKIGGDEDEYTTYTLTVTKAVDGDMADKDRDYSFTITLSNLANGTKVTFDNEQSSDEAKNGTLSIEKGLNPKDDTANKVVITGVPGDAAYSIAENLLESEGFTVKVGDTTLINVDGKYTTDGEMNSANASVTVTNVKDSVTPTGIVMNVAPYALLVVIAAAGCFVFLRKRRED